MCAGKRALARISTGSSVFSGFFVDNTTVVSVSHGLGPTTPKEVFLEAEMTSGSAFIAYRNASKDIAIFKTTFVNATITPLPIANPAAVMVGSSVMALGFPSQGGALSVGSISSEGLTASDPENGLYDDVGMAQLAVWPGNSGGPVINMSGEVVGMVVGSLASDTGKSFVHALFAKCTSIRDAYYRAAQPTIRRLH